MDPFPTSLAAPWEQLGIIGTVVIALAATVYLQWLHIKSITADHLADVKAFGVQYAAALVEAAKTNSALAAAIERIGDRIK